MLLKFMLKLMITGAVMSFLLYWFADIFYGNALLLSLLFAVAAWFAGDRLILRASNNMTATLADAVMAFAYLWLASVLMNLGLTIGEMLVIAAVVGVGEWLFHRYIMAVRRFTMA